MAKRTVRTNRHGEKMYPFSFQKHGHDIEFRINRLYLSLRDMEDHETPWDDAAYDQMVAEKEKLEEALGYCSGPVSFIPGRLYGAVKEAVFWAGNTRAETAIEHGRYRDLMYC